MIFRAVSFMEAEPPPQGAWGLRGWDGVGGGLCCGSLEAVLVLGTVYIL